MIITEIKTQNRNTIKGEERISFIFYKKKSMAVPIREKCKLQMTTTLLIVSLVISMLGTIMIVLSGDNSISRKANASEFNDVIIEVQNIVNENYVIIRVFHAIFILISDLIIFIVVIITHKNRSGSGHTVLAIILFLIMILLLWRPSMFSSIIHIIIVISCIVFCFMVKSDDNMSQTFVKENDGTVY